MTHVREHTHTDNGGIGCQMVVTFNSSAVVSVL